MKAIAVADLHLTARAQDDYRWGIFSTLSKEIKANDVDVLFIVGDLTHFKDEHPARLVNRLVRELKKLARMVDVVIVSGNHDYVDGDCRFFDFLNAIDGIEYASSPQTIIDGRILLLPHDKDPDGRWEEFDFDEFDYIFIHDAIRGSKLANGYALPSGLNSKRFDCKAMVIGGDIHVPQRVGSVTYCGSPYPINFGDDWTPRILLIDGDRLESLSVPSIRKKVITLRDAEDFVGILKRGKIRAEDQVRVILTLPKSEFGDWSEHRSRIQRLAKKNGVYLFSVELKEMEKESKRLRIGDSAVPAPKFESPKKVVDSYSDREGLGKATREAGKSLVSS